jgi:hypothetical protein
MHDCICTFLGARKVPKETALSGKSLLSVGFGEKAELVQLAKPDFGQHLFLFPNPTLSLSGIFLKAQFEFRLSYYSLCESQNTICQSTENLKIDFFGVLQVAA